MSAPPESALFGKTPHIIRSERRQALARALFFAMAVAMIVPLLAIVAYLLYRAAPSLSWEFLVDVPRKGMREGGVWPAFVGTLYLVGLSLAVSAPIGVLAAIYLHEYARDNWFNRLINLAVINLAGVPSIVPVCVTFIGSDGGGSSRMSPPRRISPPGSRSVIK